MCSIMVFFGCDPVGTFGCDSWRCKRSIKGHLSTRDGLHLLSKDDRIEAMSFTAILSSNVSHLGITCNIQMFG